MFLGGLSTTNERKARKGGAKKKAKEEYESDLNDSILPASICREEYVHQRRLDAGERPVLYSSDNPTMPREVMINYFRDCSRMLLDEINIDEIINESEANGVGLHIVETQFQRDVLERNFQMEKNFGVRYMSSIHVTYAGDTEMIDAGVAFTGCCQRAYLKALMVRRARQGGELRVSGGFSRTNILEFFEASNALMALPSTKQALASIVAATRQPPNEKAVELQRSMIELIGLNADYGVSYLNRIQTDYPSDAEIHMRMQQFAMCAQLAVQESMMTPAAKQAFYADIPPLMKNFPHVYVHHVQQRNMRTQQQQAAAQAQLNPMVETPEGKKMVEDLSSRMDASKARVSADLEGWDAARRLEFFTAFPDHPILGELNSVNKDPMAKLSKFTEMSDSDLDDMIRIQLILGQDMRAGGTMMRDLMSNVTMKERFAGSMSSLQSLAGVSVASRSGAMPAGVSGGGGGHVHSASCQHGAPSLPDTPDVSSGRADTMDR